MKPGAHEISTRSPSSSSKRFATSQNSVEQRRIWTRAWHDVQLQADSPLLIPLRFSFVPSRETWQRPGGSVEPATGTDRDIQSAGYEVVARIDPGSAKQVRIDLAGESVTWDRTAHSSNDGVVHVAGPEVGDVFDLRVTVDAGQLHAFIKDGAGAFAEIISKPASPSGPSPTLTIAAIEGNAQLIHLELYGIRSATQTDEEARLATIAAKDDRIFYQSPSYTVFGSRVEDLVYGPPAASVPERNTIVSPTRVIEGFELNLDLHRAHLQGRVVDHQVIWTPDPSISRFPMLETNWPTVDAAYRVALDVLHRCSTDEFISDPNDLGKWQSGFFMGKRFGFGIWMRDSTHVALRGGNMIDSAVARRTLIHITKTGIDNGCDGVLMPIVGLWDYFLVTGDRSALDETWTDLKRLITKIDSEFDIDRGLAKAAHSTSNDAFPEPEAGGFAIGTEAYFMLAYRSMAEMGEVLGEDPQLIRAWADRAELLRANIQSQYWNDAAGHFTTGPKGSEGYANGFWESSGQELAIWPRFGIATQAQRQRVLDRLPDIAMNEFGVDVFPYRQETDHFRGAGWVVWTTGMASAANREGRLDLLHHLIGQQVRNAVLHKTFYEVIDCETGRAWRWPGQLWQAAGFLSYFYVGVLGMEFAQEGLSFNAAVPEPLTDMRLSSFVYRKATLDIRVKGWGTAGQLFLDGKLVDRIPPDLVGHHIVELRVRPTEADKARKPVELQSRRLPR